MVFKQRKFISSVLFCQTKIDLYPFIIKQKKTVFNTVCVNKNKEKNIKLDKSDAVSYSLQNNY